MSEADASPLGFGSAQPTFFPPLTLSTPSPAPNPRRLSSHFTPRRPLHSVKKLAWISLQGRLVNADESSSARAIKGNLSGPEKVAWELFSPAQRFLLVAVIGVAVAESKKSFVISQLKKSVELRDQVLSSMQQKLDNLCEQVNYFNNQAATKGNKSVDSLSNDSFGPDKMRFVDCGCWHCDRHHDLFGSLMRNSVVKLSKGDEMLQFQSPLPNEVVEHDERRMSDLSDWASSVTSTAEIQTNSFSIDQDILNLKRECDQKDATIKELTTILQSTNITGTKRITELEEVVRRKNFAITKLKKDMAVLEQRVVHLTRLRRPSFSQPSSDSRQMPALMNNIVYDMDSTTSPSSSDSDSSPANHAQAAVANARATPVHDTANSPYSSDSDLSPVKRHKRVILQKHSSALQETRKPEVASVHDSANGPSLFDLVSYPEKPSRSLTVEIQETPTSVKLQQPDRSSDQGSTKQNVLPTRASSSSVSSERLTKSTSTDHHIKSRSSSPLKELSTNQKSTRNSSLRQKQLSISGEFKRTRRPTQFMPKDEAPKKRWQ